MLVEKYYTKAQEDLQACLANGRTSFGQKSQTQFECIVTLFRIRMLIPVPSSEMGTCPTNAPFRCRSNIYRHARQDADAGQHRNVEWY